jgi:hypothetical protein
LGRVGLVVTRQHFAPLLFAGQEDSEDWHVPVHRQKLLGGCGIAALMRDTAQAFSMTGWLAPQSQAQVQAYSAMLHVATDRLEPALYVASPGQAERIYPAIAAVAASLV